MAAGSVVGAVICTCVWLLASFGLLSNVQNFSNTIETYRWLLAVVIGSSHLVVFIISAVFVVLLGGPEINAEMESIKQRSISTGRERHSLMGSAVQYVADTSRAPEPSEKKQQINENRGA